MKLAAVIAEYNPFHSGHALHIEQTREQLGATHIAAIMSGNFVQRGDCACLPKQLRAKMALLGGADLVIELPLPWAVAGAEKFALGGVSLAEALGAVDILSFGSESGDIEMIKKTAQAADSPETAAALREMMSGGITFSAARAKAAESVLPGAGAVLRSPNDTLGVEYCKAINALDSGIEPVCILRRGAAHDGGVEGGLASASFLREKLKSGEDISSFIPPESFAPLGEFISAGNCPARLDRLDRAILYRLRTMTPQELAQLPDVSEGLENRIRKCVREAESTTALCDAVKVKRYTHARIRRIVLSALLGLNAEDSLGTPPYIRLLGMNSRGREILREAKPSLPVITRYADVSSLDDRGRHIFALEERASDIFGLALPVPLPCGTESAGIVITDFL